MISFFFRALPSALLGSAVLLLAQGLSDAALALVIASAFVHYCLNAEDMKR